MKACIETWLTEQFGDDAALVGEIYAEYGATLDRLLGELAAALAAGDAGAADRALHAIKGSAATVGDGEMSALAQDAHGLSAEDQLQKVLRKMREMREKL